MARPLRLELAGALYHLTSRGDGREAIFLSDGGRRVFLDVVAAVWERWNSAVHAYCPITNRYHLLVQTPDANLAKGMRQLNGVYTQRFNRIYKRSGHVFQGRYQAILVQQEAYLLELARDVVLNPVRAQMVRTASDWPWRSHRAMIGEAQPPEWLQTRARLAAFAETESKAIERYARFVAEGKGQPAPWEHLKNQVLLGSDAFVESMRRWVPQDRGLREVPQAKRRPRAKALSEYARPERNDAMVAADRSGGYTLRDIGDYFSLHYSRIGQIVHAADLVRREEKGKTPLSFSYTQEYSKRIPRDQPGLAR